MSEPADRAAYAEPPAGTPMVKPIAPSPDAAASDTYVRDHTVRATEYGGGAIAVGLVGGWVAQVQGDLSKPGAAGRYPTIFPTNPSCNAAVAVSKAAERSPGRDGAAVVDIDPDLTRIGPQRLADMRKHRLRDDIPARGAAPTAAVTAIDTGDAYER